MQRVSDTLIVTLPELCKGTVNIWPFSCLLMGTYTGNEYHTETQEGIPAKALLKMIKLDLFGQIPQLVSGSQQHLEAQQLPTGGPCPQKPDQGTDRSFIFSQPGADSCACRLAKEGKPALEGKDSSAEPPLLLTPSPGHLQHANHLLTGPGSAQPPGKAGKEDKLSALPVAQTRLCTGRYELQQANENTYSDFTLCTVSLPAGWAD